jgi:O-antigen/teichoic acid export membrane protein
MLTKFSGSVWAMSEYGWYPLLLLVSTPWFLHQLGTDQYGYWMLLTATIGFGGVLNTGTGAATIKAVSAAVGRNGDLVGTQRIVRASLAIAILGGGALGVLVFVIFTLFGTSLLGQMNAPELVRQTGVAAALLIWLEQLDNVFSSTLKGAEHFGIAARIEIISKTAQVACSAAALWVWPNLPALYLSLIVVAVLRLSAKLVIVRAKFGYTQLLPSLEGVSEILNFAKWGWLQGVGNVLFGVADRMLVGSLLGATNLTYYSIASQLAMQIHAASAAGLSVIFPKISRKVESKESFSLGTVMNLTMAANLVLSSLLAGTLLVFGRQILVFWIGEEAAGPTGTVLPWLAVAYWVLALNVVPYYVLLGIGQVKFVGLTVLASGLVSVIAMYFSIASFGLLGAPLGRGIYALLTLALVVPLWPYVRSGSSIENSKLGKHRTSGNGAGHT